jgi:hypothetical protein
MSDESNCKLYKDVSDVTKYDSAGPGHDYWGKLREDFKGCFCYAPNNYE